jgi:hypothetical protein
LLVPAALLLVMRDSADGKVIELTGMHFIKTDDPVPPGAGAPWVQRALPDNWNRTNPGQSGFGWYRAQLRAGAVPVESGLPTCRPSPTPTTCSSTAWTSAGAT